MFALFTYFWLVPRQINFDFYTNWIGAHEMLRGENPYTLRFTDEFLDARGYPQLHQQQFMYPATITWILLPFWVIPAEIAVSLWCGLQVLLVLLLPIRVFELLGWRVQPRLMVTILLMSLVGNYHTVNVFAIGQFTIFVLACLVVVWWQVLEDNAWLAALGLLGATIRPEGAVIAGAVALDLLVNRRYKPLVIWIVLMSSVFIVSLVQVGFWIPRIVRVVENYHYVSRVSTYPPEALQIGFLVPVIVAGIVVWGLVLFWQTRMLPDRTRLPWRLSVAILVVLIIVPQTHDYTLIYGFLPIWFLIWKGRHSAWIVLGLMGVLFASWVVYAIDNPSVSRLQQLLNPLLLVVLLTWHWCKTRKALSGAL